MKLTTTTDSIEIDFKAEGNRRCGACSLCCKLLPNVALDKPAGRPCVHQRHGNKGCCTIYPRRPLECATWSCRWLAAAEETAGMRRPDRSHYVIDPLPDVMNITNNETGEVQELQVLQIWVDPAFPATKNDPELRAYMLRMAHEHGMSTLLRWSNRIATAVFPPPLNKDEQWHEVTTECNPSIGRYSTLPQAWRESLQKSR
jgi:hypothetical protein